jgi:Na+-transporting NADH:ubiquinone oxidoreductase subunit NqrF
MPSARADDDRGRSWNGETRLIGPELLRDHLSDDPRSYAYLVAGPAAMVDAMVEMLNMVGVPEERVCADRFSGYWQRHSANAAPVTAVASSAGESDFPR